MTNQLTKQTKLSNPQGTKHSKAKTSNRSKNIESNIETLTV